jgi:Uma2 family endonuclease
MTLFGRYVSLANVNKPAAPLRRPNDAGFTARDFLRMMEIGAFEDMRAELVAGVIEKMTPAYMDHGGCNARLIVRLAEAYRGTSYELATDLIVQIDERTVRAVDIAVAVPELPGNRAATGRELVLGVEIADRTLARDLGEKQVDYARAGVPAYWVVDIKAGVIHMMSGLSDGDYSERSMVRFGELIHPPEAAREMIL